MNQKMQKNYISQLLVNLNSKYTKITKQSCSSGKQEKENKTMYYCFVVCSPTFAKFTKVTGLALPVVCPAKTSQ